MNWKQVLILTSGVLGLVTSYGVDQEKSCINLDLELKTSDISFFQANATWNNKTQKTVVILNYSGKADKGNSNGIINRLQWGGREPVQFATIPHKKSIVFIHHTVMSHCTTGPDCVEAVKRVEHLHRDINGWDDIGYNFLAGEDGKIYEARGWDREGAHTKGFNRVAVSIGAMGNYMEQVPKENLLTAIQNHLDLGVVLGKLTPDYRLYGHRDARPTLSPGDYLYNIIKTWSHFDRDAVRPIKPPLFDSHTIGIKNVHVQEVARPQNYTGGTARSTGTEIVSRLQWGGREPVQFATIPHKISIVFIHHTVMSHCTTEPDCVEAVKSVEHLHRDINGWDDIGYNFLAGEDGKIYEARGWDREGAHTKGFNRVAVSIGAMGNYMEQVPKENLLTAIQNHLDLGVVLGKLTPDYKLYGHRDARPTESPGDYLYDIIKTWSHFDRDAVRPIKPQLL